MISSPLRGHKCRICDSSALLEFEEFRLLKRVTSDSRPWDTGGRLAACRECGAVQKLVEPEWLDDIRSIYETYAIYHQAEGKEQPIFMVGGTTPLPRSLALARYLDKMALVPERARVLDFGCGNGAALRTFSSSHPNWSLYGAEISTQNLALLQRIPGFVKLFTCSLDDLPQDRFDLITILHTLEHVLDPVATMRGLVSRLTDCGVLFVQVPNVGKTPFDLVVADHLLHFTLETLRFAAHRVGCAILEVTDGVLPKELTLIVQSNQIVNQSAPLSCLPLQSIERVAAQISWLVTQAKLAATTAKGSRHFGVFGTSISATWLANQLGDEVSFFVDEDQDRIGKQHMGRPIIAPDAVMADADVYVPLLPEVAASVVERLSRPNVRFHRPPFLGGRVGNQTVS